MAELNKVIYLVPSEHGPGANKCLHKGCYEDKHTRPIAEVTARHLEYNGFKVGIAKKGTTMAQRCYESDKMGADLHVPIHTNASSKKSVRYLLFMFWEDNATYRKIFNAVAPHLEAVYPDKKKASFSVRKDLYEVKVPNAKTLYCELGFHTNETDCDKFIHDAEMVGKALAKGICDYYGVDFKEESDEPVKDDDVKKIVEEDGLFGKDTTKYSQKVLGTPVDGKVSNQLNSCKKYLPNMLAVAWEFENVAKGGSAMIKALQKLVGAKVDGYAGEETIKKLQIFLQKLGLYTGKIDGIAGKLTVIGWQKYLNLKLA